MSRRVCLIAGGTNGIGLATARLMAANGASVAITGRNTERGKAAETELRDNGLEVRYLQHDVASIESWAGVVAGLERDFGGIHVLVNSAGAYSQKCFADSTVDEWDHLFAINARGVYIGIKTVLPVMRKTVGQGASGSIVNVSSDASIRAFSGQTIYNATKGAVDVMTRGLAREFGDLGYNIRVNGVNPYLTDTDMVDTLFDEWVDDGHFADRDDLLRRLAAPTGRIGRAEDVAQLILFLSSDMASFVTGVSVLVDGGASIGAGLFKRTEES